MKCTPMIVVRDVPASSRWYQRLLGLESAHGGDEFEMLMGDRGLELMLHQTEFAEHPVIADPAEGTPGRGVLLYFTVGDVDDVFERARSMDADLLGEPRFNPSSRSVEFSLRDPDGYAVSVSEWKGEAGGDERRAASD